ncbi:MAG: D-alanyl-D-alanine carboxypeptidase/D-alanyl-D-alanine-endopeptidase [Actinomycetota bacterium]|nr:D-alanyl-D-alanine carboxypeptidase/D-alanyl-D-alanine-endopeptidase [Actinomycetota bacterium]
MAPPQRTFRPSGRALRRWAGILWLPVVCVIVALVAFNQAAAADSRPEPAPEDAEPAPSPVTPVLSARRIPETLATPGRDSRLSVPLQAVIDRAPPESCLVVSTDRGRIIYDHNQDLPLVPASNEKLLTAYAALLRLGPNHVYRTTLASNAPVADGVIQGDIWLVGSGDPVLASDAYVASFAEQPQIHTDLEVLADRLVASGITAISGRVNGDESRYDDVRYVPSWPNRFIGQNQSGPLSALSVNDGFAAFPPEGQERGGSGARTPASDPAQYAAAVFTDILEARGIDVSFNAQSEPVPAGSLELAAVDSPPLSDIVAQMLTSSDNTTAELLTKELGLRERGAGTTADGAAAIGQIIVEEGIDREGRVTVDGSGLDPTNRVPCRLLLNILVRSDDDGPLGSGLAVAGQTGTLAERLTAAPLAGAVQAKTGSLSDVTSLAGYVETVPGEELAFAMILNGPGADGLKPLEDEMVAATSDYPQGPTLDDLGPVAVDVTVPAPTTTVPGGATDTSVDPGATSTTAAGG